MSGGPCDHVGGMRYELQWLTGEPLSKLLATVQPSSLRTEVEALYQSLQTELIWQVPYYVKCPECTKGTVTLVSGQTVKCANCKDPFGRARGTELKFFIKSVATTDFVYLGI